MEFVARIAPEGLAASAITRIVPLPRDSPRYPDRRSLGAAEGAA